VNFVGGMKVLMIVVIDPLDYVVFAGNLRFWNISVMSL